MRRRVSYRRVLGVLLGTALVSLGLIGSYSYGQAYWQHRGFAPVIRLPHTRAGRLVMVGFYSPALHRRSDYLVYLPPGYTRAHRYPVYYLLHGAPGSPQDFISVVGLDVRLSNSLSEHQLRPMILVMPDGRPGGSTFFDSEWANTRAGAFESYVLNVVRNVDDRFAVIRSRQARVIAGYSAGGYGALNIALHHPAVFANVQSWSGYFAQSRRCCLAFAHASAAYLAYNSPLDYARTLTRDELVRYPLRVYMFTGQSDPDGRGISQMAVELRRLGATANYNVYPGGHDWQVWYAHVDAMMLLASQMLSNPPAAPRVSGLAGGAATSASPRAPRLATVRLLTASPAAPPRPRPAAHPAQRGLRPSALVGLLLAITSAALINLGFLLQQRALRQGKGDGLRTWLAALRSRTWIAGQGLGWLGFAMQVLAVALAPLSLVQAFTAGGLALTVPLAAGVFGERVPRVQLIAVAATVSGLVVLPLGAPGPGKGMVISAMIALTALGLMFGMLSNSAGGAMAGAVGAGLFYGVADAAIKAVAVGLPAHGAAALASGWTPLVVVGTFAGFLAFQASLRRGNAVSAISLMTSLTTLTALVFGLTAFHESLGSGPGVTIAHVLAIALVLGCVPLLAGADTHASGHWRDLPARASELAAQLVRAVRAAAAAGLGAILAVCTGTGLLYGLRGLGWLAAGPRLRDALPLLQLAGYDAQPLARVALAWLLAGAVWGLMLIRLESRSRAIIGGVLGLVLLLFASDASFAVARNDALSTVLAVRVPGPGAWAGALLLAAGAAIPHRGRMRVPVVRETLEPALQAHQMLTGRVG